MRTAYLVFQVRESPALLLVATDRILEKQVWRQEVRIVLSFELSLISNCPRFRIVLSFELSPRRVHMVVRGSAHEQFETRIQSRVRMDVRIGDLR